MFSQLSDLPMNWTKFHSIGQKPNITLSLDLLLLWDDFCGTNSEDSSKSFCLSQRTFKGPPNSFANFIFFKFKFKFLLYFTLQYCIGFAIHWHESATGVHEFPNMNPSPTSHPISSLDHPRAPAPSILYPASNIDWRFVSYMIVYMFQRHFPKSSHPLPLSQSPKVRSRHLCLFCCLTYRVIITIFLNSIYMC